MVSAVATTQSTRSILNSIRPFSACHTPHAFHRPQQHRRASHHMRAKALFHSAAAAAARTGRGLLLARQPLVAAPAVGLRRRGLSTRNPQGQGLEQEPLAPLTAEQVRRIGERSAALRAEHLRLKTDVPASSLDPAQAARGADVDADEVRRKRLLYRSKQRGWLEVDLLLGSWAAQHVPGLSAAELDEYEALLNQETIDIFQIVNGQRPPPPELEGSAVLARLQAYAESAPFGKASVEGYEAVKDKTNLI